MQVKISGGLNMGKIFWLPIILLVTVGCASQAADEKPSGQKSSAPEKEQQVRSLIETAKSCSVDDDCEDSGNFCPFGCHILVNRSSSAEVKVEIQAYYDLLNSNGGPRCAYICMPIGPITCEDGKCHAEVERFPFSEESQS